MKIGVLGTGMVGQAIAAKLVALGHEVMIGSPTANNDKAQAWARKVGSRGQIGTFGDAAAFGEVVFNCTHASLEALRAAGGTNLDGKTVVDVANVLPPVDVGPESLGQQIQKAFPRAKVVKTLNTINCEVMVNPQRVPGTHTLFVSQWQRRRREDDRPRLCGVVWLARRDRSRRHHDGAGRRRLHPDRSALAM